jgi:hypothetical protein
MAKRNGKPYFIRFTDSEKRLLDELAIAETRSKNEILVDALYMYDLLSRKMDIVKYLKGRGIKQTGWRRL